MNDQFVNSVFYKLSWANFQNISFMHSLDLAQY